MGLTVRNPRNSTEDAVFRRLDRLNRSESAPTRRARSPNYRGYWVTVLSPLPQDANHPRCIWYSSLVRTVRPSGGMADAEVSKTSEGNLVWVRPPPRAPVAPRVGSTPTSGTSCSQRFSATGSGVLSRWRRTSRKLVVASAGMLRYYRTCVNMLSGASRPHLNGAHAAAVWSDKDFSPPRHGWPLSPDGCVSSGVIFCSRR